MGNLKNDILEPLWEGFTDGMRIVGTLLWTVPKTIARLIASVFVALANHQKFDFDAVTESIDRARHV